MSVDQQRRPAFQFYPGDWLHDTALRMCSLEARGLWMDMLSVMHFGRPYGYLTTSGGVPMGEVEVARLVGASRARVRKLLAELEAAGVPSKNETAGYFSRRMVRDERLRQTRAAAGVLSLKNPNVPTRKDVRQVDQEGWAQGSPSAPSFRGSPASSSSSSTTSITAPPAEGAGGRPPARCPAPAHRAHLSHAACGRVCVPGALHGEFVRRRNHTDADKELRSWYLEVDKDWQSGAHALQEPGDSFQFWKARYEERWPSGRTGVVATRTSGNVEALRRFAQRGQAR